MVWTTTPSGRAITISFLSPRLRWRWISDPEGDQTGVESLRPDSTGISGRTYRGSIAAGFLTGGGFSAGSSSATDSAARPRAAMTAAASSTPEAPIRTLLPFTPTPFLRYDGSLILAEYFRAASRFRSQ